MSKKLLTLGNVIIAICMTIIGTVLQLSQSFVWADTILDSRISVTTTRQDYYRDDEICVDVNLRDTDNIAALNIHIIYDSDVFDVENVVANDKEIPDSVVKQDFNHHTISYVFGYGENHSGIENLLRLKLRVKEDAAIGKTEIKTEIIDAIAFSDKDDSAQSIKPLHLQTENLSVNVRSRIPEVTTYSMSELFMYNTIWDSIQENHLPTDNQGFTKKSSLKSLGTEKVNVVVPAPDRSKRKLVLFVLFGGFVILSTILTIREKKYVYWVIALGVILPSYTAYTVYASEQTSAAKIGDVNADGEINVYDICQIKAYIAGNKKASVSLDNADMNADGAIDRKDAVLITRYIAGYHVSLDGIVTENIYQNDKKYRQYLDENSYYDKFGNCVADSEKQWCSMTYYVNISNSIDHYIYFNHTDFPENSEISVVYYGSQLEYLSSEKEIPKSNRIKIPENVVYVRMSFPKNELDSLNVYIKTCEHTEKQFVIEKEEIPATMQGEVGGLAYTYWVSPQVEVADTDVFVGTVSKEGYTGVATIDKSNEKYSKNVMLEPTRADNHDSSSIMKDPVSGKLLCFTFEHDARNWINIYQSKESERARNFTYINRIYFPGSVTYAQVFYENGWYHLFTRVDVTSWYWAKSTDLKHWNFQKLLVTDDPKGENSTVLHQICDNKSKSYPSNGYVFQSTGARYGNPSGIFGFK